MFVSLSDVRVGGACARPIVGDPPYVTGEAATNLGITSIERMSVLPTVLQNNKSAESRGLNGRGSASIRSIITRSRLYDIYTHTRVIYKKKLLLLFD